MRFLFILCLVFLFSCSQSDLWKELNKNPDILPPVISMVSPRDGDTNVSISKMSVKVQFSEQMNSSSVNEDTFYIMDSFGSKIDCTVSDFSGSIYFKASPVSDLSLNSTYTVFISKDVSDMAGNKMKEDYSFSFTTAVTAPPADTISPQVTVKTGGAFLTSGKTISSSSVIIIEIIEKELSSKDYLTGNTVLSVGEYTAQETADLANDKLIITLTPNPSLNVGNNLIFRVTASDLTGNVSTTTITINVAAAVSNKVYVNSSAGDDSNIGTEAYPVKRISVAINLLNKSDECFIYLASGTYNDSVAVSGFNNGITISGGWPNDFSSVNQFNSKSIIIGENSGISVSSCSKVKLSGLSVLTNVSTYSIGSIYSNVAVSGTNSFEITCCDLQGINTGESEYNNATALKIESANNVMITNCRIRTNYERTKSYSASGIFKGIEVINTSGGSDVYVFNTQVMMGLVDSTSSATAYCIYTAGTVSGNKLYVCCNTLDAGEAKTASCLYWDSDHFSCSFDSNLTIRNEDGQESDYVSVYRSNTAVNITTATYNYNLQFGSSMNNGFNFILGNQTGTSGYELFAGHSSYNLMPITFVSFLKNGLPYDNFTYNAFFPVNSSGEYCDINGKIRPSGSGQKWSVGAYQPD
ncbi:MAG: Ig-like domain-containing protein [Spirochaetes bacterium]|nr:Ig-like domain-containing protein [Spirochaetota bacterium]